MEINNSLYLGIYYSSIIKRYIAIIGIEHPRIKDCFRFTTVIDLKESSSPGSISKIRLIFLKKINIINGKIRH